MKIELDEWQKQILETEGNILLVSGRQVGKSTIISIDAAEFAVKNSKKNVLIISHTERQAYLLFNKVLNYIELKYPRRVLRGKDRPTKSQIRLLNGSVIYCLPTGLDGAGIRGYTIDRLYPDECAYIPEEVWTAVTPMLVTTGGIIRAATTPKGRSGYVYEKMACSSNFKVFNISTEKVAESRPEPQKSRMLEHLREEKLRMTKLQYAQEYLGEFIGSLGQLFPDDLIKKYMTGKRRAGVIAGNYFLGVDVARMGGDDSTFEIFDLQGEKLTQVENIVTENTYLTETADMIINLEKQYKHNKIGIDDGGMGVAVFDILLKNSECRRKIEALNNSSRSLNRDESKHKKLLKEDMYMNLLALMEKGRVKLLDDSEIFFSLKSVQYERQDDGSLKIFGNYTHIAEGIIRACWLANRKINKLWVRIKQ